MSIVNFTVSFVSEKSQTISLQIVDVIGERVYQEQVKDYIGDYINTIDLSTQPKGAYFLQITTNKGGINKKIVLQ